MPTFQIWNKCNNNCQMCTNPLWLNSDEVSNLHSFSDKSKEIEKKMKREGDMIQFTGGEPTIHPEFFKLMYWTRENYPKSRIYLITNGRMFFYEEFTKKVLKVDRLTIQLSLLAHKKEIHNKITRTPKSFEQTVQGIKNILKYKKGGQELELRVVLTKINLPFLDKIIEFIYNEFKTFNSLVIIFPEIEGRCDVNFKNIGLRYSDTKHIINDIALKWGHKIDDFRLYHFPLCQIDPCLWKYAYRTLPEEEISFIKNCEKCRYKKYCLGIHKNYLEVVGGEEFTPITDNILIKEGRNSNHPIID